jgi:hypothetical protein
MRFPTVGAGHDGISAMNSISPQMTPQCFILIFRETGGTRPACSPPNSGTPRAR